jgi:hypothetical protein
VVEMAAKREKGECYNCTKQFSLEHLNTCPMKGIYLLQLHDDTSADELLLEADPSISLNAIPALAATNMMQLVVRLAGHTVGALIDSGSTHSFISASVAARLHLDPLHQPSLHVKVANINVSSTSSSFCWRALTWFSECSGYAHWNRSCGILNALV